MIILFSVCVCQQIEMTFNQRKQHKKMYKQKKKTKRERAVQRNKSPYFSQYDILYDEYAIAVVITRGTLNITASEHQSIITTINSIK